MKSIGIWYKSCVNTQKNPVVDVHINLWNISAVNNKKVEPMLDIGLKIQDYQAIEKLRFFLPFKFDEAEFIDLEHVMKDVSVLRLVFNDSKCEVSSIQNLHQIELSKEPGHMLLLKLSNQNKHKKLVTFMNTDNLSEQGTCFEISLAGIAEKYTGTKNAYLRFRIKSLLLEEAIYQDLKMKNFFLESAFTSTQVIDLKINKERNIPNEYSEEFRNQGFEFLSFHKIHFLLAEPANNDVTIFGSDKLDCRTLEDNEWNVYLGDEYNTKDSLVYHITETSKEGEQISTFDCLAKAETKKTSYMVILCYILVVVVMGALGSALFSLCEPLLGR